MKKDCYVYAGPGWQLTVLWTRENFPCARIYLVHDDGRLVLQVPEGPDPRGSEEASP
jgi:hypothetical protein